jgi:hypothetical protein
MLCKTRKKRERIRFNLSRLIRFGWENESEPKNKDNLNKIVAQHS